MVSKDFPDFKLKSLMQQKEILNEMGEAKKKVFQEAMTFAKERLNYLDEQAKSFAYAMAERYPDDPNSFWALYKDSFEIYLGSINSNRKRNCMSQKQLNEKSYLKEKATEKDQRSADDFIKNHIMKIDYQSKIDILKSRERLERYKLAYEMYYEFICELKMTEIHLEEIHHLSILLAESKSKQWVNNYQLIVKAIKINSDWKDHQVLDYSREIADRVQCDLDSSCVKLYSEKLKELKRSHQLINQTYSTDHHDEASQWIFRCSSKNRNEFNDMGTSTFQHEFIGK